MCAVYSPLHLSELAGLLDISRVIFVRGVVFLSQTGPKSPSNLSYYTNQHFLNQRLRDAQLPTLRSLPRDEDQSRVHVLQPHHDWVRSYAFSLDGQLIATASDDERVRIWDATMGKLQHVFHEPESWIYAVVFSTVAFGLLATTNGDKINTLDMTTERLKTTLDPKLESSIWDVQSFQMISVFENPTGSPVGYVEFATNGNNLLSTTYWCATVWSMEADRSAQTDLDEENEIQAALLSPVGTYAAWAYDGSLYIKSTGESNIGEASLKWDEGVITSLAFSPDGRRIAIGMGDGDIKILQQPWTGDPVQTFRGHSSLFIKLNSRPPENSSYPVQAMELREFGTRMTTFRIRRQVIYKYLPALTIQFSGDGKRLVPGSFDGLVRVWDIVEDTLRCTREFYGHSDWDDTTVRLWDLNNPDTKPSMLEDHRGWVTAMALSTDGALIASGREDQEIRVWRWRGERKAELLHILNRESRPFASFLFTTDSSQLFASTIDNRLELWDVATNKVIAHVQTPTYFCALRAIPKAQSWLETEIGAFPAPSTSTQELKQPWQWPFEISDDWWITYQDRNMFFLPKYYQPDDYRRATLVRGNRVVIRCHSGQVLLLNFEELPPKVSPPLEE
ncbi:hypothetical protein N7449_009756 [Penicillium cf. viridicatum]|uniref:WD40 repeat-like protein n=1 Tax=Penicillium cf. viridicatum TaxID=2972119 RepID=A0A9W9IZE1_9EURO|nr:hypothetical protein N7449_009756 [Penicillium cf. viridicatum]